MKKFRFILLILLIKSTFSQIPTIIGGSLDDRFADIITVSTGGYLCVGNTLSFGVGGNDIYIVRFDNNMDTIWTRTYGNSAGTESALDCMEDTSNGSFIIIGYTESFSVGGSTTDRRDYLVLKIDANGDFIWNKLIGINSPKREVGYTIAPTSDGGFVFGGQYNGNGGDVYLRKYSSTAIMQWETRYNLVGSQAVRNVIQTSDGGYALTGWDFNSGSGAADMIILKLDNLGVQQWFRLLGTGAPDLGIDLTQIGSYLYFFGHSGPITSRELILAKYDLAGNMIWVNRYNGGGPRDDASSMTNDGTSIYITGNTTSFSTNTNIFIIKIDTLNGNISSSARYGGVRVANAGGVTINPSGNVVVSGMLEITAGQNYAMIFETDPNLTPFPCFANAAPFAVINGGVTSLVRNYNAVAPLILTDYNPAVLSKTSGGSIISPLIIIDSVDVNICEGDSIFLEGAYQTTPGIYIDTTVCDSIIITTLNTLSLTSDTSIAICGWDSILLGGQYRTISGIYIDTLFGGSVLGCDSVITTTLAVMTLSTNNAVSICEGDSILLGGQYQTAEGIYIDTIFGAGGLGCYTLVYTTLSFYPTSPIVFQPIILSTGQPGTAILAGASVLISVTPTGLIYSWTPALGLDDTSSASPTATPDITTTYTLNVTDANGCVTNNSITIEILPDKKLFIPNVFSPNGDGYNDMFKVISGAVDIFNIKIYDRWGALVFESKDADFTWDGTYVNGGNAGRAVYVYRIEGSYVGGEEILEKGNITLLR